MAELDELDRLAAKSLEGYLVRKDLVRTFSRQFPVPTYVVEFLLGRYCASVDEEEIIEGLEIVQRQLKSKTVKAGEEELFKARAREDGEVKIIDILTARLDAKTDCYLAALPSLRLNDVRISAEEVRNHERMLTGGFYAEVTLSYDASIAQEKNGRPFGIQNIREIQLSKRDVLDVLAEARREFTTEQWIALLFRSIGIESDALSERQKIALLLRMVPFVERNYNLVELGPRGTGKSHLFQQVSPYAHLISGGKATVAKMFVNNSNGQESQIWGQTQNIKILTHSPNYPCSSDAALPTVSRSTDSTTSSALFLMMAFTGIIRRVEYQAFPAPTGRSIWTIYPNSR